MKDAWGSGVFQNRDSRNMVEQLLATQVYPVLMETVQDTKFPLEVFSYHYNRVRVAVEIMLWVHHGVSVELIPEQRWTLAVGKLREARSNSDWLSAWQAQRDGKKLENYQASIDGQLYQIENRWRRNPECQTQQP